MIGVVTGGLGFIGSHIVRRLIDTGYRVRILDSGPAVRGALDSRPEGVEALAHIDDAEEVHRCLNGADVVFHFAGSMLPNESNLSPEKDISETLAGNIRFINAVAESNVGRIVFASSGGTVYGVPRFLPIPETHPTDPICSYGIVKLATEKYLALYERLHRLSYTVVRLSNPYGEGQNPFRHFGVIASFLGAFAQQKPIEIWGDGAIIRDFLYIDDAVEAILLASAYCGPEHIFNVGSATGTSIHRLLNLVRQVTGRETEIVYKEARSGDVPAVVLDIGLARRELVWTPSLTIEEGIAKTWSWCASKYGYATSSYAHSAFSKT